MSKIEADMITIPVIASGHIQPGDVFLAPQRDPGETDAEWFSRWGQIGGVSK